MNLLCFIGVVFTDTVYIVSDSRNEDVVPRSMLQTAKQCQTQLSTLITGFRKGLQEEQMLLSASQTAGHSRFDSMETQISSAMGSFERYKSRWLP